MQDVTLIGIDLGKHSFHLHGQDRHGNPGASSEDKLPPMLGKPDSDRLLRFAMTLSRLLAEFAERHLEGLNQQEIDKRKA